MTKLQTKAEQRLIQDYYDDLLKACDRKVSDEGKVRINKAFEFANSAHAGVKRKSGEPYIIHPIAVATIVVDEIGLSATSIISALLHDVVEDTDYTLEDISNLFGEKVASIVDGLTKLTDEFTPHQDSKQANNFRKMLMTLSDDVRVILIKLADRLHNMRTLDSMAPNKQLKIAAETLYIFAPLAHRLGLYAIKSELEDLSLKYKHPDSFNQIQFRLHNQREKRDYLVTEFIRPIEEQLKIEGVDFTITERLKSIYSIWNKMQTKGVSFDEVYDLLAIRIVFVPDPNVSEKRQCFDILSLVTDIYKPKPDRIRDWITIPKANGYEALHITVMGPQGKWVEIQIRTQRMDEIAERGFAAHYKYKNINDVENELDKWLQKIKEMLQNPESDALEFLDEFKMNLFSSEIIVFTPKGRMVTLPKNATVLDFAYEIHTELGNHCIGAKINHKLVPISHVLLSGDQVEILSSKTQTPQLNWLNFLISAKAKAKVKQSFKLDRKKHVDQGRQIIEDQLAKLKIAPSSDTLKKLTSHYNLTNKEQLYAQVGMGFLELDNLGEVLQTPRENKLAKFWKLKFSTKKEGASNSPDKIDKKIPYILKEDPEQLNYTLAKCCNPIPGDDVVGYVSGAEHIIIHKRNCPEALKMMSQQGDSIITAEWTKFKKLSYLSRIKLSGFDRVGIVNEITTIISKHSNINMRTVHFDTHDGIFEGDLYLYIHSVQDLAELISRLMKIKGIDKIERIEKIQQ
ncbi:MAG: bifunctional (p)ppGpp synthetase/guanosine-3',5'-bis(diphosphate) 3'-pyrophosphohydrolase [Prolixibacteraceae bacterium]|nr:bifunctional (p)ppGpp synthetase/guanosine-3',5'-bis(diphosphate) 3'-pyrophosphohydrolase [Prolixibacteraceae bacterium]